MNPINIIKNKLTIARKLIAVSCKLSGKLKATSYKLTAVRGFTLIETLVAISILMIAVASPLTIAQKGLSSAIYAKDQITASYLAQDAIEYIINASGQNIGNGNVWLKGITNTNCDTACEVDTWDALISECDGTCPPLKYDEEIHIYNYQTGLDSQFTRSVKVEENPANEALITVTISWTDKSTIKKLDFYTRIFNWHS